MVRVFNYFSIFCLNRHDYLTCRWLSMERKFAFEKVDNLFMETGSSVWESEVGKIIFNIYKKII